MTDNTEARLAVLEKQAEYHEKNAERIIKQQDEILSFLRDFSGRLGKLEDQMLKAQPTIEEFVTVKTEIKTAGKMGRAVWMIGGWLIAFLASAVTMANSFKSQIAVWAS